MNACRPADRVALVVILLGCAAYGLSWLIEVMR